MKQKRREKFIEKIKSYCNECTVHGLKYITQPERHFSERIFWSTVCMLSGYLTIVILKAAYNTFDRNPVSFVCDSAYLDWNTSFPAVTLCELDYTPNINQVRQKDIQGQIIRKGCPHSVLKLSALYRRILCGYKWDDAGESEFVRYLEVLYGSNSSENLIFYLADIAFFKGTCDSCEYRCFHQFNCSNDYDMIVNQTRRKLNELVHDCSWNRVPFNCSDQFVPVSTEIGTCYTMNSYSAKMNPQDFLSNRRTGLGKLRLNINSSEVRVFIHPHEDIPFRNTYLQPYIDINAFESFKIQFSVTEIENDPALKNVPISRRKCRFPNENYLKYHKWYSYSACITECRINHTIELCNCTHHFQPKIPGIQRCNISQLICLTKNNLYLRKLKSPGEIGMECQCLGTCIESEYTVKSFKDNQGISSLTVQMINFPSYKFLRKVVRNKLELVVSMGGTAGLFLGASLLSIVEFFYYIIIRRPKKSVLDKKSSNSAKKTRKISKQGFPKIYVTSI